MWNKLNSCLAFVLKYTVDYFLKKDVVLLLFNLTFFVHPILSAPAKHELNGSNDTFLEADIVRNYGVDSRSS